ncbi:MAG TPA: DUF2304 family protein [Candidatus Binatia bacterium]|jgi:hypothetical protein|nr:DUF2304 family protein [Candidatus Binatia bacterium]
MVIQVLLIAMLAGALVLTWRRSKQGALSRLGAFLWSALWIAAAIVVLRPEVATFFASLVGVGRGADAVIYVSIIALFYLVFRIFLRLDKLDRDLTALVRKVSVAERDARRDGQR